MASESQDRDPPAQTEGSRNNEASDAGAGANENTPLLAESDPSPDEAANEHIDGNGNARDAHGRPTNNDNESTEPAALRATLSFTFMSLVFTFVTLVILFVCNVVISSVTWHPYLSYYMQDYINYLTGWSIFVILLSLFNFFRLRRHLRTVPLVINLILDLIIAFTVIGITIPGLAGITQDNGTVRCPDHRYDPNPRYDDDEKCSDIASVVRVLIGILMSTGLVFGIMHLALAFIRFKAIYQSQLWRGPWTVPFGRVSVEFSVRVHGGREREREEEGGNAA
ncbi:hypothetical protein MMC09_004905 [Bachmanniomyces sp. S44760]|nr:hypothetical protein [Bachmanniomyces sp. S44760]